MCFTVRQQRRPHANPVKMKVRFTFSSHCTYMTTRRRPSMGFSSDVDDMHDKVFSAKNGSNLFRAYAKITPIISTENCELCARSHSFLSSCKFIIRHDVHSFMTTLTIDWKLNSIKRRNTNTWYVSCDASTVREMAHNKRKSFFILI